MRKLNNNNRIDGFKETVENAFGMKAKKPKEMAATAGVAVIYGLLFAGLLFAPLPPHLAAQSNSPTNNSPTNSISTPTPTDHPTGLGDFDNARSEADCLKILNEKKEAQWNKFLEAQELASAAWDVCLLNRTNRLKLNEAVYQHDIIKAESDAKGNFWGCLGFGGGPATAVAIAGTRQVVHWVKKGAVAVGRVASATAGAVVSLASFIACRISANNDLANAIDAANEVKRIQDEIARTLYSQCMETSYRPLQDKADWWFRKYKRNMKAWERQYAKCVEFFEDQEGEDQDGNCATID